MPKEIGTAKIGTIEELNALVQQRYEAVPFEHPNFPEVDFQISILNNGEREHVISNAKIGTLDVNVPLFNRLIVAYGLVTPQLMPPSPSGATRQAREQRAMRISDMLRDYPDELIIPIADEVWRLTNEYRDAREGGNASPNFSKRPSGSSSGSSTEPASTPTLLKVGGSKD